MALWSQAAHLTHALTDADTFFRAALASDDWLTEFSGKEIFRPLRDHVYQPRGSGSAASHDSDLASAIGTWQQANGRVPSDLADLLAALRSRVGLPP